MKPDDVGSSLGADGGGLTTRGKRLGCSSAIREGWHEAG